MVPSASNWLTSAVKIAFGRVANSGYCLTGVKAQKSLCPVRRLIYAVQVDAHAEVRLQSLTQIYNLLTEAPQRLDALLRGLAYAQRAGLTSLLAPTVKVGILLLALQCILISSLLLNLVKSILTSGCAAVCS